MLWFTLMAKEPVESGRQASLVGLQGVKPVPAAVCRRPDAKEVTPVFPTHTILRGETLISEIILRINQVLEMF